MVGFLQCEVRLTQLKCRLLEGQYGSIWLPDTERFFMDLSRLISSARQQQNATATQLDSAEFFIRRLEEYERTLSVLTLRVEESYTQEACLIDYLFN